MLADRFLTLPEPFETVAREMDQVFENVVGDGRTKPPAAQAPIALWEDDRNVYLEVEVPGLRQDDLDVSIHEGRLIIAGERKPTAKDGKCWFNEHRYGRFQRVVALSDMIEPETIEAELADGILSLTLYKKPEAQPHRIAIKAANGREQPRLESQAGESAGAEPSGMHA